MRKGFALLLLAAWLAPTLLAEPLAQYLTFTARGKNRIYLRDVKIDDVSLLIDEKPVKVSMLGYKNVDTAFVFLLENSPRTAEHPVSMPQWGKINKIDQIRYQLEQDYFDQIVKTGKVMLAEFSREVKVLQHFTQDDFRLEDAISRMQPNFTEIIHEDIEVANGFAFGIQQLQKRTEKRKVLVLITTTVDRLTYKNLEEYKELLRAGNIELYVVSFAQRFQTTGTFEQKMNRFFFLNLVEETAGKLYLSGEYAFVPEFMDDLRTRLEHSYTIGFYVQPGEEKADHSVKIAVRNDKVEVTHKKTLVF